MKRNPPLVVIASGLDPTGGAGLMADIRAASYFGVRTASIITASTIQGRRGVSSIHVLPSDWVGRQMDMLISEFCPSAVKLGMPGCARTVRVLSLILRKYPSVPVVLDPVWRATAGGSLSSDAVRSALLKNLLPLTACVTPNLDELCWLTGMDASGRSIPRAARKLLDYGCRSVLVKGGHRQGSPHDLLVEPDSTHLFRSVRLKGEIRGTGCALASGIAACMANGMSLQDSIRHARSFVKKLFRNYNDVRVWLSPAWKGSED